MKCNSAICPYLTEVATKILVSACILSRLDYGHSVLMSTPEAIIQSLLRFQNAAAQLICKSEKHQHYTLLLKKK